MYLRKSYLYNSIMKDVSYSLKQILDETLGSLYLNDKEKSIVDKIFNDIDTEKYKNNKLSYKDYQQIANSSDNLYNLQYDNILPWLEHLEIIIIENDSYNSTNAAAMLDTEGYTSFSKNKDKILYATIVIINPKRERFTKNKITHELNHYYSEFRKYQKTGSYNVYSDLDLNFAETGGSNMINFLDYDAMSDNLINFSYVMGVFTDCLYLLNESEIKAHIEDIYSEIHDNIQNNLNCKDISDIKELSQTLEVYYNVDKILHFYKDNLDSTMNKMLQRALVNKLKSVYGRNRLSLNQIYSKQFNKLKKIYKHVNRLYVYCKNEYLNDYGE